MLSSESYNGGPTVAVFPPTQWVLTAEGYGSPPHVTVTSPWYVAAVAGGKHFRGAVVGFHKRRIQILGRKIGKMNGRQRRIHFANYYYTRNGLYPDIDVLDRHPNETDNANGTPRDDPAPWPPASTLLL